MENDNPEEKTFSIDHILTNENLNNLYRLEWNRRISLLYGLLNETNKIPQKLFFGDIDGDVLFRELKAMFPTAFVHYNEVNHESEAGEKKAFLFVIRNDLIVHFENSQHAHDVGVIMYSVLEDEALLEHFKILINSCRKRKEDKNCFYLLTSPPYGLELKRIEIVIQKFDLSLHYNDDFVEFNDHLVRSVTSEKRVGKIVLMNGLYGTGKTFYIRHLIATLKLEIIYLTSSMAAHLGQPELTEMLLQHDGEKAIVIEDAELLISRRNEGNSSIVSSILNLSDGILGDALKVKLIIITSNSKLQDIDPAVLRKGRLLVNYEFGKLKRDKAQKLSDSLGYKTAIVEDLTLAEIYNQEAPGVILKQEKLGFNLS
ncbi:MAG TPA: AAA family ATPase, partial [Bacteroidia bacterium]|nr:AAA family ATPase [Bacteroidia bacterium]